MSSPRLRSQFERLFEHFQGEDSQIQLDELTDILCCTRRNTRIVLNKMAEEGWIEWLPAAGRGKLSQLRFHRNKQDISNNLARRYLEEGKIEHALAVLDNDAARLTQVLQQYLGFGQSEQGQQVIRLPYYRQLANLNPLKPTRRSEQHIIGQVFSGLTRLDEQEQLQPDLAHHWQMLSPQHWRFYLRIGVRFHNGERLNVDDIINSLQRIQHRSLFAHIEQITSPTHNVLDIQLSQPDHYLPLLLTETAAKILPSNVDEMSDFALLPIGTGPYQVVRNDDKRLVLKGFDRYFGYRPLIEQVEVWVIDKIYSTKVYPTLAQPAMNLPSLRGNSQPADVALDPGCTYLLLNRSKGLAQQDEWANYFASRLNALSLLRQIPDQQVLDLGLLPAHGLKPGWQHSVLVSEVRVPEQTRDICIAYHGQHPLFPQVVQAIKAIFKKDGLSVTTMTYEMTIDQPQNVDIWIKPMGVSTYRDDALLGWLLDYSDIAALAPEQDFQQWQALVDEWRAQGDDPFPAKSLAKQLVESKQIIPMFHCWLGVSQDHCGSLQNASCNALGWFDFSQVWVKPE